MAEARRAPVLPGDAPPNLSTPSNATTSNWEHWELLALAALGATFGFLTGIGLWSEIHERSLDTALLVIILALAAYVFIDPIKEWLDKPGAASHEAPEGRKLAALMAAVPGLLVAAVVHHALSATEETHTITYNDWSLNLTIGGWGFVFVVFCCITFACLCVTHFGWVRGVQQQPRQAALRGAIASLVVGIILAASLVWYLHERDLLPSRAWGMAVGVLAVLWFFGPGLLGGLAINRCRADSSPSTCIIRHFALWSIGYLAILLGFGLFLETHVPATFHHPAEQWKEIVNSLIWLPVAAMIAMNLGWAFAPYFRRKACDRHLGLGECGYTPKQPKMGAGLAIVPRDSTPLVPEPAVVEKHTPPAEMVLKPTGDRLWATVALVLMLIVAGLAYYAGTMRKDPEIINTILIKLQQDSGLQQKGLKVHSEGRVVTLAGRVDNEFEHEKAVQEASSVRGVKEVIDRIQVAPATPAAPAVVGVPAPAPAPNATTPVVAPPAEGNASPAATQNHPAALTATKATDASKPHATPHVAKQNKPVTTTNAAKQSGSTSSDTQRKSFFDFVKKETQPSTAQAEKQPAASQPADTTTSSAPAQKKSFFSFLKKKNKNQNPPTNGTNSNVSH